MASLAAKDPKAAEETSTNGVLQVDPSAYDVEPVTLGKIDIPDDESLVMKGGAGAKAADFANCEWDRALRRASIGSLRMATALSTTTPVAATATAAAAATCHSLPPPPTNTTTTTTTSTTATSTTTTTTLTTAHRSPTRPCRLLLVRVPLPPEADAYGPPPHAVLPRR